MGFAQADPPLAETRLPAGPLRRSFSEASRQGLSRIIIGEFVHIRIIEKRKSKGKPFKR
jgi:hypothetical protein